jgi:hypothetical protein|tara:strand:+ start:72 stop:377 length:306 start_codon:yes stop_codon:yes gene_type:complete
MYKKPLTVSIVIFFVLMVTTSIIKNKTRNIEKNIEKLTKEIAVLDKQLRDSKIDFVYLSTPEKLRSNIVQLSNEEYVSFDYSRIFLSLEKFLYNQSKQAKK